MKSKAKTVKPIKTLSVPTFPATDEDQGSQKNAVIGLILPGHVVQDYNEAAAQEKAWAKIKEDTRPQIEDHALVALYAHNCEHTVSPVKTVAAQDDTGAACNVTFQDRYKAIGDPATVALGLANLGQTDPNAFVVEKLTIGFDASVFWDENGQFRAAFYMAAMTAMRSCAEMFECNNPLSSDKVTVVRDGFAEERWKKFTADQQPQVSALLPTTISLTPVAPKKAKE